MVGQDNTPPNFGLPKFPPQPTCIVGRKANPPPGVEKDDNDKYIYLDEIEMFHYRIRSNRILQSLVRQSQYSLLYQHYPPWAGEINGKTMPTDLEKWSIDCECQERLDAYLKAETADQIESLESWSDGLVKWVETFDHQIDSVISNHHAKEKQSNVNESTSLDYFKNLCLIGQELYSFEESAPIDNCNQNDSALGLDSRYDNSSRSPFILANEKENISNRFHPHDNMLDTFKLNDPTPGSSNAWVDKLEYNKRLIDFKERFKQFESRSSQEWDIFQLHNNDDD